MQQTPSAVYHYSDAGGANTHHNKVNAIFQAAKKDLLQVIQIQVTQVQTVSTTLCYLSFHQSEIFDPECYCSRV